jgi:hypothetical protein
MGNKQPSKATTKSTTQAAKVSHPVEKPGSVQNEVKPIPLPADSLLSALDYVYDQPEISDLIHANIKRSYGMEQIYRSKTFVHFETLSHVDFRLMFGFVVSRICI